MSKSLVEKVRTPVSKAYGLGVLLIYLVAVPVKAGGAVELLFPLGVVLVTIACVGRLWCNLYVSGYKTRVLIVEGPYATCRNPLYFFSLVGVVGIGLCSQMLTVLVLLLVPYIFFYPFVIRAEERKLLERHGAVYAEYMVKTPRFFPNWSLFSEPESYQVNPKAYKKEMTSAVWFVWAAAAMELVEILHNLEILPTLLRLY